MTFEQVVADLSQVANELGTLIETAIALIASLPTASVDTTQLTNVLTQLKAERDALSSAVSPGTTLPPVTP